MISVIIGAEKRNEVEMSSNVDNDYLLLSSLLIMPSELSHLLLALYRESKG